jgi:hypothetical protein
MRPASVALLWRAAAVAIFRAEVTNGPSLTVHPLTDGSGFVWVVWNKGDVIRQPVAECIADGGRCRAKDEAAAIAEAVRKLARVRDETK